MNDLDEALTLAIELDDYRDQRKCRYLSISPDEERHRTSKDNRADENM
jgi:hypothetical protein